MLSPRRLSPLITEPRRAPLIQFTFKHRTGNQIERVEPPWLRGIYDETFFVKMGDSLNIQVCGMAWMGHGMGWHERQKT